MRVPFDKYERVILIDTYMKIKDWPKSEWVKEIEKLSDLYRHYGVIRGLNIDDKYRNLAGITMQIHNCDYVFTGGKHGLSGGAGWISSIMEVYDTDPEAFQAILREARERMYIKEGIDRSDLQENRQMSPVDALENVSGDEKQIAVSEKSIDDTVNSIWDKFATAQMLELYYALREVDSSEWDEMMRQECVTLEKYNREKYKLDDTTEPFFTITELAMKIYGFKLLEAGQGIEGEDYSTLDKEMFSIRLENKSGYENILHPNEKELLPVAMERQWDEYEIARLTYECANLKGNSIIAIIQDFYDHLRKYASDLGFVMDVSRTKGAINRHALEIDYLLTDGRRGRKGGSKADKNIVSMYRFRNTEFQYLLTEANKKLGYEQEGDPTENVQLSWYNKDSSFEHKEYSTEKQSSDIEIIKESERDYQKEKESALKSESLEIDKTKGNNVEDKYREIMEDEYPNGIRLNSKLDFNRFAGLYKERYGTEINHHMFIMNIMSITYDDDGRRKLKNNQEQNKLIDKILNDFEDIYAKGFSCIYNCCVFPRYKYEIEHQMQIYGENEFWSVMERSMHRYNVNGFGHITPKEFSANPDEDVRRYIRDVQREITYDELEQDLWFIPIDKIKQVVRSTSSIINTATNTYMSIKAFPITSDELRHVRSVIKNAIITAPARQLQAEECRRQIYIECKSVKINTEMFSTTCFQKALGYLLSDDFNFTTKFVTPKNVEIDTGKMYREFCDERDQFTLEELKEFSKEINTPIRHDIIHDTMVRIDENNFVKDSFVKFDAKKIDAFIEENICTGKYMSLKKISSLVSNFPSVENYRWTGYLLESYIYSFSEKYELLNSSFSEKDFNGVMIRRDAGKIEFDDIIMDVLARKECNTEEEALNELKEDGYITRANYKGINIILEKAKIKRRKIKGE
ncbi:hypothetical protein SAMN05216366_1527 [Selenomonas ruminantium]|uniref:Uncharacterized protein n=2 Tax=Selenomonas ruminantium TaxID=971 RepID=A0A1H0VDY6_SELRU|nr:hypothetical protein SAMN05216366_1527 [Selenomonas ruminantium]